MNRVLPSSDHDNGRYNIFDLQPRETHWMNLTHESNTQYLAVADQPVRFWILGEIDTRGAWLIGQKGSPLKSVSVRIRPVRGGEIEKWSALFKHLGGHNGM